MFTTITICAWDLHLDYVFKTTLYHHQKDLLVEENLGFLAIYLRQWFILFPSRRKWMETRVFLVIVHSVYPKSPPQTSWNKLKAVNCKVVSKLPLLHKTIGNAKSCEKVQDIKESHLTLQSLAWDSNKNVLKDSRDLFHCSTQHST